jgi:hypothetical protein
MLIIKFLKTPKKTDELEIKKNVDDNCNLSSPEVQRQLNLKILKKTIEA